MDFNFLANQSRGETDGDPADNTRWQQQTVDSYLAGFDRVYYGSRARCSSATTSKGGTVAST